MFDSIIPDLLSKKYFWPLDKKAKTMICSFFCSQPRTIARRLWIRTVLNNYAISLPFKSVLVVPGRQFEIFIAKSFIARLRLAQAIQQQLNHKVLGGWNGTWAGQRWTNWFRKSMDQNRQSQGRFLITSNFTIKIKVEWSTARIGSMKLLCCNTCWLWSGKQTRGDSQCNRVWLNAVCSARR